MQGQWRWSPVGQYLVAKNCDTLIEQSLTLIEKPWLSSFFPHLEAVSIFKTSTIPVAFLACFTAYYKF